MEMQLHGVTLIICLLIHISLQATVRYIRGRAPLTQVVTRLTAQKGTHLIKHAAWRTLERGGQFVLLGSAPDPRVQVMLL